MIHRPVHRGEVIRSLLGLGSAVYVSALARSYPTGLPSLLQAVLETERCDVTVTIVMFHYTIREQVFMLLVQRW